MSTRRSRQTYSTKQKQGSNGRPACLECDGDITDRRRTFCSKRCADAFSVKTNPAHARHMVFERDKGICAVCGKDVFEAAAFYRNGSPRLRKSRGSGDLWQADHIIPVIEGGGECGIDNLRTLCTDCHLRETAALKNRIAAKNRQQKEREALEMIDRVLHQPLRFGDPEAIRAKRMLGKRTGKLPAENQTPAGLQQSRATKGVDL